MNTLTTTPIADPAAVIAGANHRITVLDAGLVRLEYSESGLFEDRASQTVIDRAFPVAEYTLNETDERLEIHTARLQLIYDKRPFSTEGLSVQAKGGYHSTDSVWRFGVASPNLGGTARTLDEVDGACPLEPGVLAFNGVALVDDSRTVLLTDDGWVQARTPGNLDLYVFAFGRDYRAALKALYKLTGPQPLLPRFALGNWWSRYHPYTADEYLDLVDRFAADEVPLSVAVLDMDWHLVEIDPKYGSGWTGYTWNTDLFPDPAGFLDALHQRGMKTSLNVHPAEGVHAHEKAYPAIASRLGIDPASELPVNFDPVDRDFIAAYLEELHHPLEDEGVDFWWLDWQQGGVTKVPGLDPLWLLNHVHYLDSARGGRRPLTFSRYAGVGSHRYPIGFSGDTVITWASLDFQPYFTATASNVGYGWWSHDIGGHFFGAKDDELAIRWVQFGVFSPVMRLHSSLSPFLTKEPWRYGEQAERVMKDYLRLRHQLVPYLYTMNARASADGEPLVQPMYYEHPSAPEAYQVPNQYLFGDQLIVAPITTPGDRSTLRGSVTAWLPPGQWVDVFTGMTYDGGRMLKLHRDIDSIPVLAKAGAIVPMVPRSDLPFGTSNPEVIEARVYAGASGSFVLTEDADDERWAETSFAYSADSGEVSIGSVTGPVDSIPDGRRYDVVLCGFASVDGVIATFEEDDLEQPIVEPGPVPGSVRIALPARSLKGRWTLRLTGDLTLAANDDAVERAFTLLDDAQILFADKQAAYAVVQSGDLPEQIAALLALDLSPALLGALVEFLTARSR